MLPTLLLLFTMAFDQSYYWLAGLDKSIPIYTQTTKDGSPGPLDAQLGYDRDTHQMSILYPSYLCETSWGVRPSANHGAIVDFFQVSYNQYALIHEDGFIRLELRPDFFHCNPIERKES